MSAEQRAEQPTTLTSKLLKYVSGYFDLECIRLIDLSDKRIENIDLLKSCANLEILILRYNAIRRLDSLSELLQLKILDIAGNMVYNLDCLKKLENLQDLNAAGNCIAHVEDLSALGSLAKLHNFRLIDRVRRLSNPVRENYTSENEYRAQILRMLPELKMFDGVVTTAIGSQIMALYTRLNGAADTPDAKITENHSSQWLSFADQDLVLEKPDSSRLHVVETELKDLLAESEMLAQIVRHRNNIEDRSPSRSHGLVRQDTAS